MSAASSVRPESSTDRGWRTGTSVVGDWTKTSEADAVDRAINQVLSAEREARERVERCRVEAANIVAAAEVRARAISERTEKRIKAAHRIADAAVELALADLMGEAPKAIAGTDVGQVGGGRLERAIETLLDEITGTEP